MMQDQIFHGDCLDVMRTFADNSVDSIVTDPPAGISFMNKAFDSDRGGRDAWIAWLSAIMSEALRCLKPGGHAFVWALPRTSHWTALALEDAGFEIREKHYHLFSTGFPKSLNVSKAIDKLKGAEREIVGKDEVYARRNPNGVTGTLRLDGFTTIEELREAAERGEKTPSGRNAQATLERVERQSTNGANITAPATPEAERYDGWGSATKPAAEEWILCRKPLSESSIAANVLKWGTGGLNIDKCRVAGTSDYGRSAARTDGYVNKGAFFSIQSGNGSNDYAHSQGRFPSNVVFSHSLFCTDDACSEDCAVLVLEKQSGGYHEAGHDTRNGIYGKYGARTLPKNVGKGDEGTASRFYHCFTPDVPFLYTAKSSRSERNNGIPKRMEGALFGDLDEGKTNIHPTVKSLSLMSYLVKLITPPCGLVLDCFAGSGSTGVAAVQNGFHSILIEQEQEYVEIIRARMVHAHHVRSKLLSGEVSA